MDIMPESEFVVRYLAAACVRRPCRMIQIGANEGRREYVKVGGKDFIFEFLLNYPAWSAVLVEPMPEAFALLKKNYADHKNDIAFFNCAITEKIEDRVLKLGGREGKMSFLRERNANAKDGQIVVPCIDYRLLCRLVGWDAVDFVKIDTEGYDAKIIQSILACEDRSLRPDFLIWESVEGEQEGCERALVDEGYRVFRTGLTHKGEYLDNIAIQATLVRHVAGSVSPGP